MPSVASGNSCCTAWASTCAVEWRRIDRPSGLPACTGSTASPAASGYARSRSSPFTRAAITAAAPVAGGLAAACPPAVSGPAAALTAAPFGLHQCLARGRARLDHMLAACEGDAKLAGGHG